MRLRTNIESKGFEEIQEVCGAFVTFEHQAAARVAADLFHPDLFRQCFREPPTHSSPHPTERHLLSCRESPPPHHPSQIWMTVLSPLP